MIVIMQCYRSMVCPMLSIAMNGSLKALKLFGMAASYDDILSTAIRERQTMAQFLASLCQAEAEDRRSRSIRYQMGTAGFPVSKGIDTFIFNETPINEQLLRTLYQGDFLDRSRNIVLVGGTARAKLFGYSFCLQCHPQW